MNLGSQPAAVDFVYVRSDGSETLLAGRSIPVGGYVLHNPRRDDGLHGLPDGWEGALIVRCTNGQPIGGYESFTRLDANWAVGDTLMAQGAVGWP